MRKSTKKGFTIVELVIVVAVIAILAAVLIPTFTGIVNKARESSDIQLVRNLNTALATDKVLNGEHKTMQAAIDAAYEGGFVIEKLAASAKGNKLLWDSANGLFCYYDADAKGDQYVYAPEAELTVENPADYQYWEITDEVIPLDKQKFSIYYNGADIDTYPVKVGFDAGNAKVGAINYTKNANEQTVVIRTNSAATNLSIDAVTDTVYHYGPVGTVDITKIDMSCYYENGSAAYVKIAEGKVVATAGKIEVLFVNATETAKVAVEKVSGAIATGYAAAENVAAELGTSFTVVEETAADAAGKEAVENAQAQELVGEFWISLADEAFAGGSGTEADPYLISNATHLARLAKLVMEEDEAVYASKYYKLSNDVDLSGKAWTPIGTEEHPFMGEFDGDGKAIIGLTNNAKDKNDLNLSSKAFSSGGYGSSYGLFGVASNATIKNIRIEKAYINSDTFAEAGFVVGRGIDNITISGCTVDAESSFVGLKKLGGIIGHIDLSKNTIDDPGYTVTIEDCTFSGSIEAKASNDDRPAGILGALCGNSSFNNKITINNCVVDGTITSTDYYGAFIAHVYNMASTTVTISNCTTVKNYYAIGYVSNGYTNNISTTTWTPEQKAKLHSMEVEFVNTLRSAGDYYSEFAEAVKKVDAAASTESDNPGSAWQWYYSGNYFTFTNDPAYDTTLFAGGSGTKDNPYLIETREHMANISENYDKYAYYKVIAEEINLAGFAGAKLNGSFNGNGVVFTSVDARIFHTVGTGSATDTNAVVLENFTVKNVGGQGVVRNGFAKTLTFKNINVTGYMIQDWCTAAFLRYGTANYDGVGFDYTVNFENCSCNAEIFATANSFSAVLIGHAYPGAGHIATVNVDAATDAAVDATKLYYYGTDKVPFGYKYAGMGAVKVYVAGVETANAKITEGVVRVDTKNPVKLENGSYGIATEADTAKVVAALTFQYSLYEDAACTKPIANENGIGGVIGDAITIEVSGAETAALLGSITSVEVKTGDKFTYTFENGKLTLYVTKSAAGIDGWVTLNVEQYAAGSNIAKYKGSMRIVEKIAKNGDTEWKVK